MMSKGASVLSVAAVCLLMATQWAISQEETERPGPAEERITQAIRTAQAVGRYQLIEVEDSVLLLDTATGRIWNRSRDGEWSYEGNPARDGEQRRDVSPDGDDSRNRIVIIAPHFWDPTEFILYQREEQEIPGSKGTVLIRMSDITDGQALLSVVDAHETILLGRRSVSQGDLVDFSIGDRRYTIYVKEMRNLLTGNDFAKLVISEGRPDTDDEAEESVEPTKVDEEASNH